VLASAVFLAAGAAGSAQARAADDPATVRFNAPCYQALADEMRASQRLKSQNATPDDARQALRLVDAGMSWNEQACHKLAGRSAKDNANRQQMYQVNKAFLLSLKGQAQSVLGEPGAAATYAQANRELGGCIAAGSKLPAGVRANCATQLANNRGSQQTGTPVSNDPCQVALQAANDAGDALKPKDYANFEKAYLRASDGIAANKSCSRQQMRDVNNAYLLSWKAVADRYLDVPFSSDRDLGSGPDPFAVPNDLLRKCGSWGPPFPAQARIDCTTQLATNLRFLIDYNTQPPSFPGQTIQPLNWQQIEWQYSLRPDFVWDAPCKNNEKSRCADEEVRDGSGPNGWGPVPPGAAIPVDGDRERVLFATIRNCDDLNRLFTGQPPQVTCDFFKSNIVLVVAQHKPHQQCGMTIDRVQSVGTSSGTNPARDAVRLNYTLTCTPPVGASGSTAMKVVSIPSGNANGTFANVTFVQSGGGGPRSATP
jgi:hypothetical protein